MLKVILIVPIAVAALYVLLRWAMPLVLTAFLLLHERVFTKGDEPVRPSVTHVPPPDEAKFSRLAREAMGFASAPFVTTVSEVAILPFETILVRTVSDVFGRRMYVETQRRVNKTLHTVLCAYVDGALAASASLETPVSQVRWDAYFAGIEDLRSGGPHVAYVDDHGRRREVRLRPQGGQYA